jgi:dTMP kinase
VIDRRAGRFIAVEGIDGSGKTTQARILASRLDALLTFEPGATALGSELRRLVLEARSVAIDDRTEALLMVADRAEHVAEVVAPALADGSLGGDGSLFGVDPRLPGLRTRPALG